MSDMAYAEAAQTPDFKVRSSKRAKRPHIRVTPHAGVEVIVPEGCDIDAFAAVRERNDWIAESLALIADQRSKWTADLRDLLPAVVDFAATGERWRVEYVSTDASAVRVASRDGSLRLTGSVDDPTRCLRALQSWLHRQARTRLLPLLAEEAERAGLVPSAVGIRGQRDRWAGCSVGGAITLNRALLFLPRDLVRAVILHELAHLDHPDHSAAFRARLAVLDPEAEVNHRRLRDARGTVPGWAERRMPL